MKYAKRIERVQKSLFAKDLEFLIIDEPANLYYLTGQRVSRGRLCLSLNRALFFLDGRYFESIKKKCSCDVEIWKEENVENFFCKEGAKLPKKIGFDSHFTTFLEYQKLSQFFEGIRERIDFFDFELNAFDEPLKEIRMIKEPEEVLVMKRSAALNWKGFEYLSSLLKEGIKEIELAWEFEKYCRQGGAEGMAFSPMVCFGENSAYPHHMPGNRKLKANDVVLLDIGVVVEGYHSDMTRILFFGEADPKINEMYSVVRRAHSKALSLCKPGMKIGDIDRAAREVVEEAGFESYPHNLGHGIGLDTHEFPIIGWKKKEADLSLKQGMVFTIEPGIYIPGLGGIRYEDTIWITSDGFENLY